MQLRPEALRAMPGDKANTDGRQIHLYQCDHLGTPLALIDQQGKIAWAARVGPWGGVIAEYNPENLEQPIRLPGQHEDSESGLYYNRHRYYDSKLGKYIIQDPIGLRGGSNTYRYPLNPMNGMDPIGLWSTGAHNYFIDKVFSGQADPIKDIIKEGSAYSDKMKFQGADYAFMHAMSSEKMDASASKLKMCAYIKEKMEEANDAKNKGSGNYWFLLGMALHPVMDSTSPAHEGYQSWGGIFKDGNKHGEMPGTLEGIDTAREKYHTDRTTQRMRDVLNGDLSSCGCK